MEALCYRVRRLHTIEEILKKFDANDIRIFIVQSKIGVILFLWFDFYTIIDLYMYLVEDKFIHIIRLSLYSSKVKFK